MVRKSSSTKKRTKRTSKSAQKKRVKKEVKKASQEPDHQVIRREHNFRFKKIVATVLVVFLIGFIVYALRPFINAFLGAFIVYFLFRPFYRWLIKKEHVPKQLAAGLVLLTVLLVVLIPLSFGAHLLIKEVSSTSVDAGSLVDEIRGLDDLFPSIDLGQTIETQLSALGSFLKDAALNALGNFAQLVVNVFIFLFTLYYLFIGGEKAGNYLKEYVPFNRKNARILFTEFKKITKSTVFATGAIGLAQGILMAVAFAIFGVGSPMLWGFISMIFAMLPVVGITFIWIPAALILAFVDLRYGAAIGLTIWGLIVTNLDYLWWRPMIQRKMGKLHPLITLVGIFMGLPIFGILGLVLGPLLLSFVILMTRMYVEEFLD